MSRHVWSVSAIYRVALLPSPSPASSLPGPSTSCPLRTARQKPLPVTRLKQGANESLCAAPCSGTSVQPPASCAEDTGTRPREQGGGLGHGELGFPFLQCHSSTQPKSAPPPSFARWMRKQMLVPGNNLNFVQALILCTEEPGYRHPGDSLSFPTPK